jgi:DnaJ-domain-containing protein 1
MKDLIKNHLDAIDILDKMKELMNESVELKASAKKYKKEMPEMYDTMLRQASLTDELLDVQKGYYFLTIQKINLK